MHPGCAGRAAQDSGNLNGRIAFIGPETQAHPLFRAQMLEETGGQAFLQGRNSRLAWPVFQRDCLHLFHKLRRALPALQVIKAAPEENGDQSILEALLGIEPFEVRVDLDKGFLTDILGVSAVAQNIQSQGHCKSAVSFDNFPKILDVSPQAASDQLIVVHEVRSHKRYAKKRATV